MNASKKRAKARRRHRAVKCLFRCITFLMFVAFLVCVCALDSPAIAGKAAFVGMMVSGAWLGLFCIANSGLGADDGV